jgi:hypothetical protein
MEISDPVSPAIKSPTPLIWVCCGGRSRPVRPVGRLRLCHLASARRPQTPQDNKKPGPSGPGYRIFLGSSAFRRLLGPVPPALESRVAPGLHLVQRRLPILMLSTQLMSLYCAIFWSVQGQSQAKVRLICADLRRAKSGRVTTLGDFRRHFAMQHRDVSIV